MHGLLFFIIILRGSTIDGWIYRRGRKILVHMYVHMYSYVLVTNELSLKGLILAGARRKLGLNFPPSARKI